MFHCRITFLGLLLLIAPNWASAGTDGVAGGVSMATSQVSVVVPKMIRVTTPEPSRELCLRNAVSAPVYFLTALISDPNALKIVFRGLRAVSGEEQLSPGKPTLTSSPLGSASGCDPSAEPDLEIVDGSGVESIYVQVAGQLDLLVEPQ